MKAMSFHLEINLEVARNQVFTNRLKEMKKIPGQGDGEVPL